MQTLARRGELAVVAAKMCASGVELEGETDIVVDDHRDCELLAEADDGTREVKVAFLLAVLQERDTALERKSRHALDVARLGRDGVEPAQLHERKKRFGRNCPPPGLKPAASASQVKRCAARAASGGSRPLASSAAMAEARVQPEPW